MKIKQVNIYREGGVFQKGDLSFEGEIITNDSRKGEIDGTELYAIPGLIDMHLHGCVGYDFCDGTSEAFDAMTKYQAEHGVTAITPASMTLSKERLKEIFSAYAAYKGNDGAMMCGIYMEGPFFSSEKKGAQNPEYLHLPDVEMFEQLQNASNGNIKVSCVAPELEGAFSYIEEVSKKVKVSIAHTTADYDIANHAFLCGASHVTHLFNAMMPFGHRSPNVIGAASDNGCAVEIICDGIHLHPCAVRTTFRLFGKDKVVLISDSMMATGLKDGDYSLGGQAVKVVGNKATLGSGTIAGSATNLFDCMKTAVSFGIPLETALQAATENPAKEIGEYHRMGSLTAGKLANIVLVDSSLNIKNVFIKGKQVV